ncbi:hypothetical protein ABZP36_027624 [Zizania latifolia]
MEAGDWENIWLHRWERKELEAAAEAGRSIRGRQASREESTPTPWVEETSGFGRFPSFAFGAAGHGKGRAQTGYHYEEVSRQTAEKYFRRGPSTFEYRLLS